MKIRELSIKNCLSFGEKGLNEKDCLRLGDYNLFIGANNAGKSNILKLVELLKLILLPIKSSDNLFDFPLFFQGDSSYFKDWFFGQALTRKMLFKFSLEIEETDQVVVDMIEHHDEGRSSNPVLFMLRLKKDYPRIINVGGFIRHRANSFYASLMRVEIPNDHNAYNKEPVLFDSQNRTLLASVEDGFENRKVYKIKRHCHDDFWNQHYPLIEVRLKEFLGELYDKIVEKLCVTVVAVRKIEPGGETINSLADLRDHGQNELAMLSRVQDFIKELIFTSDRDFLFNFPQRQGGKRDIQIKAGGCYYR